MPGFKECISVAIKAGKLTQQQADRVSNLAQIRGDDADEVTRLLEDFIKQTAERKRVAQIQVLAYQRATKAVASHPEGAGRGIESILARDPWDKAGHISNADARGRAVYDKARSLAPNAYDKLGVRGLGLVTDDALDERVGRALFKEAVDAEASGLAKELSSAMEMPRQRFNNAGGNIPKRENYGLPQTHDVHRIATTPENEWLRFLLPEVGPSKIRRVWVDGKEVVDKQGIEDFLQGAYKNISDAARLMEAGHDPGFALSSLSRDIDFDGFDNWMAYSKRFGHGEANVLQIVNGHLMDMSKKVALAEILGPKPRETLSGLLKDAALKGELTAWQSDRINRLYSVVSGEVDGVRAQWLANSGAFLRSGLVAAQLAGAVLSSFNDVVTGTAARMANDMPLTRAFDSALRGMTKAEAARLGIAADHALVGLTTSRFGEIGGVSGFMSKVADVVLRLSGLTKWTEAGRRAFGIELLAHWGDQVDARIEFAGLSDGLQRSLSRYGITPEAWNKIVLRTEVIEKNGAKFLDLDGFSALTKGLHTEADKLIAEAKLPVQRTPGGRLTAAEQRRIAAREQAAVGIQSKLDAIRDTENRLRELMATESEFAMISGTDARIKAMTTMGAQRGTLVGELARSGFLYKTFPLSIAMYHIGRGLAQPTAGGKIGYLAAFTAASTIIGGLSLQAKELIKGRDVRPMDAPGFWVDSLAQGGAISIFDALLESDSSAEKIIRQLVGPVPALVEDAFNLTVGNAMQAADSDVRDTKVGEEAARFAERYTPGSNLWYTRRIVKAWLWDNVLRLLDDDPDQVFRRSDAAARRWGRGESWWQPGEPLPDRAPNFGGE